MNQQSRGEKSANDVLPSFLWPVLVPTLWGSVKEAYNDGFQRVKRVCCSTVKGLLQEEGEEKVEQKRNSTANSSQQTWGTKRGRMNSKSSWEIVHHIHLITQNWGVEKLLRDDQIDQVARAVTRSAGKILRTKFFQKLATNSIWYVSSTGQTSTDISHWDKYRNQFPHWRDTRLILWLLEEPEVDTLRFC